MPELQPLLLFIAAGLLLNLTPGPDVLYIVSRALRLGTRAGIVAGFGITAGCFVHIAAAAVGVSALMAASTTAFSVLRWAGAAYLLWVGVRMIMSRPTEDSGALGMSAAPGRPKQARTGAESEGEGTPMGAAEAAGPADMKSVFFGGFWTNALNPKVALFFLAFLPQFIAHDAPNKPLAFFLLGVLFNFNAIFVNTAWAVLAGWAARRVGAVRRGMHWLERGAGVLFVAFSLKLALSENPLSTPPIH